VFHLTHRCHNRVFLLKFARAYNRRKNPSNAFWGDNFHATLVEDGRYLWRCLCYIELNMVRCGVVAPPRIRPLILSRRETEIVESADGKVWAVQEAPVPYGQERDTEDGSNEPD